MKHKRRKRLLRLALNNDKYVAECLYAINKEAKRFRDNQNKMAMGIYEHEGWADYYDFTPTSLHHNILHACKDAKSRLYQLKNNVLDILIKQKKALGGKWHAFDGELIGECFTFENYQFHGNIINLEEEDAPEGVDVDNLTYIGTLDSQQVKNNINPKNAEECLTVYASHFSSVLAI
jgi:hypothetical protein